MGNDLSRLAHDLRTPLTALKMGTSLLAARGGGDPDYQTLIATMQRNIARLERVADELTGIAKRVAVPEEPEKTAQVREREAGQDSEREQVVGDERTREVSDQ